MTTFFDLSPTTEIENDGWILADGTVTKLWQAWERNNDNKYSQCPSHRGAAHVGFPVDTTELPDGAVIDTVTIFIRMKTSSGSGTRTVTVNVMSQENRSRYTTRTLQATSAYTTVEVGTFTKDALGFSWDVHRLNTLRLRVFSQNNVFDAIRVAELYCRVNYHVKATVTVKTPTGTVFTPSPAVSWDYTHVSGEPQSKAEYRVFTASQVSAPSFSPDIAPPQVDVDTTGEARDFVLPTSLGPDNYRIYVRAWSQGGARTHWAYKDFAVQGPAPGVPGDDNAGESGTPGLGTPKAIPDTYTSSAQLRMRDASNLLSAQQADFEVADDPLEFVGLNCTLARSAAVAFGLGTSMSLTASSGATMSATSTLVEITAGSPLTVRGHFSAAVTGRTVNLRCTFYDDAFLATGTPLEATGADVTGGFTELTATGTSPADAVRAEVVCEVVSPAGSEVHYVDKLGLMYGTDSAWTDGGHQSRNLLTSHAATGDDPEPASPAWEGANVATSTQRVTVTGLGGHGLKCHQMTYLGASGSIVFRGTGSVFTTPSNGTSYTLNRPAGTTDGDLMLAFVTSTQHGTITPPAGWTAVNTASVNDGSTDVALFILKRTAVSTDPSSWSDGAVDVSSSRRTAVVVSYGGCAAASDQFIAENTRLDPAGGLTHRTQIVTNTDPNAWRVAAFAASDDVASGAYTANVTPPVTPGPIQFVAASQAWSELGNTSNYKLNCPSFVVSGDLLIASVVFSGKIDSVTAPSGWTLVRRTTKSYNSSSNGDAHSGDVTVAVLKRTAGSSEPQSWTGSHSDWGQPKGSRVVAYRNCADASLQFIAENSATKASSTSVTTASVTNTDSKAWRVCVFGASTRFNDQFRDGDVVERADASTQKDFFPDVVLQVSDSNAPVSTGSHSRTARVAGSTTTSSGDFFTAIGWIGIIKPLASPPAQGSNETERVDNNNGSSNPWLSTAVYDSNGTVAAGPTSVYGQFTPGSGNEVSSMASWIGIIKPAAQVTSGTASARLASAVDISMVDSSVLDLASSQVTVMASFLGGADGTPLVGVEFYRANVLISSAQEVGSTFNTTSWTKSWAVFELPEGTTRVRPVLSATGRAVSDTVQFDRVAVTLGAPIGSEVPAWRNGTARAEHPVWSKPVIQYADDTGIGYGDWTALYGQKISPPQFRTSDGLLFYTDHTVVPLNIRKYRVQNVSYGLAGDTFASGFGPDSNECSFTAVNWWLKDLTDPATHFRARVKWEAVSVDTSNTSVTYQPLGEEFAIVLTEGYKSDEITLTFICDRQEEALLASLLRSRKTLLLQSDQDYAWWVRPVDTLNTVTLPTGRRTAEPIKEISVKFVQVKPEE